jgi:predicted DNA-binding protein
LALDFASRCAVAGLQLGRTKVFLRREAFERIEGLRSEKFYNAASAIQKITRGKLCREYYQHMRNAAIVIQSVLRVQLSKYPQSCHHYAVCSWRLFVSHMYLFEMQLAPIMAAMIIQRTFREWKYSKTLPPGPSEDDVWRAVVAVQAMHHGGKARSDLLNLASQPAAAFVGLLAFALHIGESLTIPMTTNWTLI